MSAWKDPCDLTIAEAGQELRAGRLSAVDLLEAHLERISARDEDLAAFVLLDEKGARRAAEEADAEFGAGRDRGALHGIPVALKDLIDVTGMPTRCGSRRTVAPAGRDAALVTRLRAGGAVILGKLMTYEFALVGPSFDLPFPPSRNPHDLAHITGGSSSGSAAAVAGGLVRTAIGTDTGGSIRSPAAYCGVVGLKPTYDAVPVEGVFALSRSLDHAGPISRTVAEAALTLDVLAGTSAAARLGEPVAGKRIAYARDFFALDTNTDPAITRLMDEAVSCLSLLGAKITLVELPAYDDFEAAGAVILQAEALEEHAGAMAEAPADFGALAFQNLLSGLVLEPHDVIRARAAGRLLAERVETVLSRCDGLVLPTTLTTALPFSAFEGKTAVWTHMRTFPFNLTGHPVLSVPMGFVRGLPAGMQIVGRHGDEAGICAIGQAFETATDYGLQRPSRFS